jgi:hypothetical protein
MSAQPPDAPDSAGPKQDGRFRKGVSGNPAGMRRGTQHKLTREGRRLATKEGPEIVKKIAENAKSGDAHAQRLFMQYLYPRSKLVDDPVERPPPSTTEDAVGRIADIVARMEQGLVDLDEGTALVAGLQAYISGRSVAELEAEVLGLRETVARLQARVEQGGLK